MKFLGLLFISVFLHAKETNISYANNLFDIQLEFDDCDYDKNKTEITIEVDLIDPIKKNITHKNYYYSKHLLANKDFSNPIIDSGEEDFTETLLPYLGEAELGQKTYLQFNKRNWAHKNEFLYDPRVHGQTSPAKEMLWKITLNPGVNAPTKGLCNQVQTKEFIINALSSAYTSLAKVFRSKNRWVQESRFAFDKKNRTVKGFSKRNDKDLELVSSLGGVFRYDDKIDHSNSSSYPPAQYYFDALRENDLVGNVYTTTFPLLCVSGWSTKSPLGIEQFSLEFVLNHVRTPNHDNIVTNEVTCNNQLLGELDISKNYSNTKFTFNAPSYGKYNCKAELRHQSPDLFSQANWEVLFLPIF